MHENFANTNMHKKFQYQKCMHDAYKPTNKTFKKKKMMNRMYG